MAAICGMPGTAPPGESMTSRMALTAGSATALATAARRVSVSVPSQRQAPGRMAPAMKMCAVPDWTLRISETVKGSQKSPSAWGLSSKARARRNAKHSRRLKEGRMAQTWEVIGVTARGSPLRGRRSDWRRRRR